MKLPSHIAWLVCGLMLGSAQLQAQLVQGDVDDKNSRVAVLPFVNHAEVPEVMPEIMRQVRIELERQGVILADSVRVADALRRHRIRSTGELTTNQTQALSAETSADYLLVGALDRYLQGEDGAETALAARLIYVPTGTIEWIGAAERHTRNGVHPLDLGREPAAEQLVKHTLRDQIGRAHV